MQTFTFKDAIWSSSGGTVYATKTSLCFFFVIISAQESREGE